MEKSRIEKESFEERIKRIKSGQAQPKRRGFHFSPFSKKQRTVIGWWTSKEMSGAYDGIIADGAIRSGKTLAMTIGFILWAMNSFSGQNFAICGKTIGSVERNILVWLRQILPGRGYRLSENRSMNLLTVSRGGHSNRFYCFGGKDEGSQDLIQGMTLAGVFMDEVALMPESFVLQATARCSVEGSKWWFNCNPGSPYHWFKRDWIDRAEERRLLYKHFSMKDNLSLSPEMIARYENMYNGVFYRRYVLGEWCAAEGLVYPMFDRECHVGRPQEQAERYFLSCDYGTHNPFALGLISVRQTARGTVYCIEREFYHDGRKNGQLTDSQYADRLERFAGGEVRKEEGGYVIVDPSASSFIAELRRRGWKVVKANNDVSEGIRLVAETLTAGRLMIDSCCLSTLKEFSAYMWDNNAAAKGEDKPIKQNDHAMDMLRYALYTDSRKSGVRGGRNYRRGVY